MIRMAWHSAGTYRISDGRGGAGAASSGSPRSTAGPTTPTSTRPAACCGRSRRSTASALLGRPDRAGRQRRLESMGFKTFGFAGGRADAWEPDDDVYWGPEDEWLGDERYTGDRDLENPLAAVQMGLIYVNPEGPNGNPDPLASARDIRETFARMAMNDEETVALIAGGHTFGKTHGAGRPRYVGPEPEGRLDGQMGLGWQNTYGSGSGRHHHQRPRRSPGPTTRPAGTTSSSTSCSGTSGSSPRARPAHSSGGRRTAAAPTWCPRRSTRRPSRAADAHLRPGALRFDPIYEKISRHFLENPDAFADAFARAWFKLTHRDMGPVERYLGPRCRRGAHLAGPGARRRTRSGRPTPTSPRSSADPRLRPHVSPAGRRRGPRPHVPQQRQARWRQRCPHPPGAAAQLGRQQPGELATVCPRGHPGVQRARPGGKISLADLIVLGATSRSSRPPACAGVEVTVPLHAGSHRRHPGADRRRVVRGARARRRRLPQLRGKGTASRPEYLLVDRANLLNLSAPEMTVLVGGLRVLGANTQGSSLGVLTDRVGVADQRLLRQPARHRHEVDRHRRRPTTPSRAATGPTGESLDRHARRPGLRFQLRAARRRRGLRQRRRGRRSSSTTSSRPGPR
jgi:catalase-peroxidase